MKFANLLRVSTSKTKNSSTRTECRNTEAACPICENSNFRSFRGREDEICAGCGAKSRTRLMYMTLEHLGALERGNRVLHFAPEPGLREALFEIHGNDYVAADFSAKNLEGFDAGRKQIVDLCSPPSQLTDGSFDAIIHSHVFEHLPCNWALAFLDIHRALGATGIHFFSVPVSPGYSREDLSPELRGKKRQELFGQDDHMRVFGTEDFPQELEKLAWLTNTVPVDAKYLFSDLVRKRHRARGMVHAMVPKT